MFTKDIYKNKNVHSSPKLETTKCLLMVDLINCGIVTQQNFIEEKSKNGLLLHVTNNIDNSHRQFWAKATRHKEMHTPWFHWLKVQNLAKWIQTIRRQDGSYFKWGLSRGNMRDASGLRVIFWFLIWLHKCVQFVNSLRHAPMLNAFCGYILYLSLNLDISFPQSSISSTCLYILIPYTPYWQDINDWTLIWFSRPVRGTMEHPRIYFSPCPL